MRDVRAALLAGGKGERLGRLTERTIKPLVPYAGTCRLVDFSLANAQRSGISEVVLMSMERERELIRHVLHWWGGNSRFHVHLGPNEHLRAGTADDDAAQTRPLTTREPELGTADALITNEAYVFAEPVQDVLVQHADHVYLYDYGPMLAEHRVHDADVTIGVQRIERRFVHLFGMVDVDGAGRVTRLVEKPTEPTSDLIFSAFALFRADVLRAMLHELADLPAHAWQHDISRDVLPGMIARGFSVRAFEVDRYWADIGTVERYHLGHMALLADPELLPSRLRPTTLERAAPLQVHGTNLWASQSAVVGEARYTFCYTGSVVEKGATVIRSILMPGARVRPGVHVQESVVLENEVLSQDRIGLQPLELHRAHSSRPGC
jgi:valienol-1-phosphate guanylyltransferase